MKFNIYITLILLNNNNVQGDNCNKDINFIGTRNDIDNLGNCSYLNGSLFINGDYNLNSLEGLEGLKEINGFLVIIDSHMLKNYKGLHRIKKVNGNDLYLKYNSVVSKYNNNFKNDTYRGLCYTDLIDWHKITDHNTVNLNNGLKCPNKCHSECIGCFGPGPKLCQECRHFNYNDTCVSDCYFGNKTYCHEEFPLKKLDLTIKRINNTFINLGWNALYINETRGIIKEYKLIFNNNIVVKFLKNDNDYDYKNLIHSYIYKIDLNKIYNFTVCYSNDIGELCSRYNNYTFYDLTPTKMNEVKAYDIHYNWVDIEYKYNFTNLVSYTFNQSMVYHSNNDNLVFYYSLNDVDTIEIDKYPVFRIKNLYDNKKFNISITVKDKSLNKFSNRINFIYFSTLKRKISTTTTTATSTHDSLNNNSRTLKNSKDFIKREYVMVNNVTCGIDYSIENYLIVIFFILYIPLSILMMVYIIRKTINRNEMTILLDKFINRETRHFSNPIYGNSKVLKRETRYLDVNPVDTRDTRDTVDTQKNIDYYTSSDEDHIIQPCKIKNLVG